MNAQCTDRRFLRGLLHVSVDVLSIVCRQQNFRAPPVRKHHLMTMRMAMQEASAVRYSGFATAFQSRLRCLRSYHLSEMVDVHRTDWDTRRHVLRTWYRF